MTDDNLAILTDAARVYAAGRDVRAAVADLAVRPLSEPAADRMRSVLSRDHAAARQSLRRLRERDVVREIDPDQNRSKNQEAAGPGEEES